MVQVDLITIVISLVSGASGALIVLWLFNDKREALCDSIANLYDGLSIVFKAVLFSRIGEYIDEIEVFSDVSENDLSPDDVSENDLIHDDVSENDLSHDDVSDALVAQSDDASDALVLPEVMSSQEETPKYIFEKIHALPIWLQFLYFIDNDNLRRAILNQAIINDQCFILNHSNIDENDLIKTHNINKKDSFNMEILGRIPKIFTSIKLSISDNLVKLYWDKVEEYYSKLGKNDRVESDIIDMNQLVNNLIISLNLAQSGMPLCLLEFEYYKYINFINPITYMMIYQDSFEVRNIIFAAGISEIELNNQKLSTDVDMQELYEFYYKNGGNNIQYTPVFQQRQDIKIELDIGLDAVLLLQYYKYSNIREYMRQFGLDVEHLLAQSNNKFIQDIQVLIEDGPLPELMAWDGPQRIDDGIRLVQY